MSSSANLHTKIKQEGYVSHVASMENLQKFEYFDPNISALLSDIKPNKVAPFSPNKTFLQLKGFDKIRTDNREIEVNPLTIHAIMAPNHNFLIFQIFKNSTEMTQCPS